MSSLLNQIEPLKLSALAELKAAPDLAALERAKGIGSACTADSPP